MHLRSTTLIAFCDGEAGANRSRRTASHVSKCERCSNELQRIQIEKEKLSVDTATLNWTESRVWPECCGDLRLADRQRPARRRLQ
jgi:anti-sigma factor RsiW